MKLKVFIELFGCFVFRIYYYLCRSHLAALSQAAIEDIDQEKFSHPPSSETRSDREAAQQPSRDLGIFWKFLGNFFWQFDQIDRIECTANTVHVNQIL
jgi:hypothetical protein